MDGPIITAALAGTALAGAAWAVRAPASSVLAPSVYRGPRSRRAIALTFDDGPSESTPLVQRMLERFQARATFFQCGMHVRRLPAVSRDLVSAGHELGNHTYSHRPLWLMNSQVILNELTAAQDTVVEATETTPTLFRAPYGVRWLGLREAQKQLGLLGVMWTAIGLDWKLPPDAISKRLASHVENGAIFCLHDGRGTQQKPDINATLEALATLLPQLTDKGFQLVTVSDLLRVE